MEILFLHQNFPGQFRHIAQAFGESGNNVRFMCQTHYNRTLPYVERITLKKKASYEELQKKKLSLIDRAEAVGEQFRHGLLELKFSGWNPDLVISHSGWGCGLHVKEIWPKCRFISYLEWWFNPESSFFKYNKENKELGMNDKMIKKCWLRNQHVALELSSADNIISPTNWQKSQLPASLRSRCHVIFDGIDLERFKPIQNENLRRQSVITYGTRGMDPMRCFPEFIKALPDVLKKDINWKIEIAGQDEAFYGSKVSENGATWGAWAKEYLKNEGIDNRVKWLGTLPKGKYEKWLQTSGCHVYLSHPFVASWSLIEAYCCGTPIVCSDIEPVREVCYNSSGIDFIDHRLIGSISKGIEKVVNSNQSNTRSEFKRNRLRFGVDYAVLNWSDVAGLNVATID